MPARTQAMALAANFMGHSPDWYKLTIVGFLILNPVLLVTAGPFFTGWLLIAEFIFTLAMALKCYPLQPGGLLAVEAVILGMTPAEAVYQETATNLPVIMLLMFMVAGIYFLKDLLLFVFARILLKVRSKVLLSLLFCVTGAILSAFLDALTVTAVVITVATGFYGVFHRFASGKQFHDEHDSSSDEHVGELSRGDLDRFRAFLRSLMMHAAVGTALGGITTLVGEPQNLLIGKVVGWEFMEFFYKVAPVSVPVLATGFLTCVIVEKMRWFGFGAKLPENVRIILVGFDAIETDRRTPEIRMRLIVQAVVALILVFGLAFHLAEVGLIGLTVIVLATAFNGITEEHQIGNAFKEALPFTALLVVFFCIVAVIHEQHLFAPVIHWALAYEGQTQVAVFYLANGILSAISDNVFVATVYITDVFREFEAGRISREQLDLLAVAINTGTNLPSVATPNGQAAFLFLLTSGLAPLIRLSYMRMVWMAFPYTIVMTATGLLGVIYLL
ncbi:MAG: sodium/proton antiporter NhaB [Gammaproteobacteria bacterium]|nr:sodium/proton antiporter NhaB [Gammaproteobacteria bacterium]